MKPAGIRATLGVLWITWSLSGSLSAQESWEFSPAQRKVFERRVRRNTSELPHLPDFSAFHEAFSPHPGSVEGDMRSAYFLGYDADRVAELAAAQLLE